MVSAKHIIAGAYVNDTESGLPVTERRLDLGSWRQVYYAEFDGRRRKRVLVKIIGEYGHALSHSHLTGPC